MSYPLAIRPYRQQDEKTVVELWKTCGLVVPWNEPKEDIERKLAFQPRLFLVGLLSETVVATVMAGFDGHRGWINYLAVAADCRDRGLGRQMVEAAESALALFGCPKINLQVRATNAEVMKFYERLGYRVDEVISMGKRL